jgi:hypothetical protein
MPPARAFAEKWACVWNAHDLEGALALFAEDVVFTSPLARKLGYGEDGVVRGKPDLRAYWAAGLAAAPNLHFQILWVMEGIDLIVIGFCNEQGVERCEIL